MAKIEVCPPCTKNAWEVYDIRHKKITKWLPLANEIGAKYGVNPAIILAVISIESNGDIKAGGYYGLTQIGKDMLNTYNSDKDCNYKLTDLRGEGPNITNENEAASLGIEIFTLFVSKAMLTLDGTSDIYALDRLIKDATTRWNGSICNGTFSMAFYPFGDSKFYVKDNFSCYGFNVYRLMSVADSWCSKDPWNSDELSTPSSPSSSYVYLLGK